MKPYRLLALAGSLAALILSAGCSTGSTGAPPPQTASALPDISGLAWVDGNEFLAIHDVKHPDDRPSVSLISLPASSAGPARETMEIVWPAPLGSASDLESIARIPGTSLFLLAESGQAKRAGTSFRRIFLTEYRDRRLDVVDAVDWPVPVHNVEGAAVARSGDQLVFLFAERAEGEPQTLLRWASLSLQPMTFGPFQEVAFSVPDPAGPYARPVSAIEVDDAGRIIVASAIDTGNDSGPFRSVIWRIGRIEDDGGSGPRVVFDAQPTRLATLDGIKVEALALRPQPGGAAELFFGTDDEHHGGIIRHIPLGTEG
ncbi:MAG: hypothetical protein U1E38_00730 [Rhodospirillales bacterium]